MDEGSRLFVVRLWTGPEGRDRRGRVRDVATGAYRHFREWAELTSFLEERVDDGRSIREEA